MSIQWTPNLSVGVEHIDDQHKFGLKRLMDYLKLEKREKAKEYINTMIDFLDEYTKQHFKDEEAYMEEIAYPELEAQKRAHASFIKDLQN